MPDMKSLINAAQGYIKSDLIIKNINIVNVFSQEIEIGDIAIYKGKIVGIGKYEGEKEIDCSGMYASPGFIDSHVHVESSMTTPPYFSKALLKKGVTTAIADPHEIANVLGNKGVDFMLSQSDKNVIDIYYMAPSCVPATTFEDGGAELRAEDLKRLKSHNNIIGLAEVMDISSVLDCKEDMILKIEAYKDYIIDGHAPLLTGNSLNAYIVAGVKTDHECSDIKEALEKIRKGMYVLVREGSAAKNLKDLLPAITDLNFNRFLFCTDDRHGDDLLEEGSIDNIVRNAIALGLNPIRALTIASLNAAQAYNLKGIGAIAPGYKADIVIFNDINKIDMQYVIKNGIIYNTYEQIADNYISIKDNENQTHQNSVNMSPVNLDQFKVKVKGSSVNVIDVIKGSLITNNLICNFKEKDGFIKEVNSENILKIAVFERHKSTGKYFVGYIRGLGIKNCAIAQTIAHDSHNIIVVGDKDEDMEKAVNSLINVGGGIAIAENNEIKGLLDLPIGGLMKPAPIEQIAYEVKALRKLVKKYSDNEDDDIFLTLSFMSLPVIPYIKITARGIFDYNTFNFISLFNR